MNLQNLKKIYEEGDVMIPGTGKHCRQKVLMNYEIKRE